MVFIIEGLLNASDVFPFVLFGDIGEMVLKGGVADTGTVMEIKGFEHIADLFGFPDHGSYPGRAGAVGAGN